MLIAISGSQGSGKSTILSELKKLGYPVIERKTARSILLDWDVTLDIVNSDFTLKRAFQEELFKRKTSDELEASLITDNAIFTERTYSDLFTYSLISFGQYNKFDAWLDDYFEKCKECCKNYEHVFYVKANYFDNIERDGVHSINKHYSKMIDHVMRDITKQMVDEKKFTIIDTNDLKEQLKIITDIYK